MEPVKKQTSDKQGNVVATVYGIAKMTENIIKRDSENSKSLGSGEHPEIKTLRERCKDPDVVVSASACQAIVSLVTSDIITIPNALSTFLAILPFCPNHGGITSALSRLLVLDMEMKLGGSQGKYKNPFNLHSPQHPLLTVLRQKKDSWQCILGQVAQLCLHPNEKIQNNSYELVWPVVLYMMCHPDSSPAVLIYRQQLWAVLLSMPKPILQNICLPWLQLEEPMSAQSLLLPLARCDEKIKGSQDRECLKPKIAFYLANSVDLLVSKGEDPYLSLRALDIFLMNYGSTHSCSVVILMMANTIGKASPSYLTPILQFCSKIIKRQQCSYASGKILVAALLPWLSHPSELTAEVLLEAQIIHDQIEELVGVTETPHCFITHPCPLAHRYIHVYNLFSLQNNPERLQDWLKSLDSNSAAILELRLFFGALLITTSTSVETLARVLKILTTLADKFSELGTEVLTWILYRLARETDASSLLELLRALPLMGKQKENAALVIHTLESFKTSVSLRPVLLNLYLRLWHLEPRCFPYLHKLLSESQLDKYHAVHWDIARAATIKEICETRPNQHGKELVPILSNILNTCMDRSGCVASSLALQAIAALCRAKVVDTATTWSTLAPRLAKDSREAVIASLCEILGLLSTVKSSNPDQKKLFAEAQSRLWTYVVTSESTMVFEAAFKALSNFSCDQFILKSLPACYRQDLKLPAEYCKTPIDAARKPEDVLPYIPGEVWVQLLNAKPNANILMKSLLFSEVKSLRGALHRRPGRAESSLPPLGPSSVCVALVSLLRKCSQTGEETPGLLPALNILAGPLPQQLPPCDWSILVPLSNMKDYTLLCLQIAATQAQFSPSAQQTADLLVKNITEKRTKDDLLYGFSILGHLCKGVSPNTLRQFIDPVVTTSLAALQNNEDATIFMQLMSYMKDALAQDDIHDANRTLLSMLLEQIFDQISTDDKEALSCYVESCSELYTKFLDRMTTPSSWWEITSTKLRKSIIIRGNVASRSDTEAPLNWFNDCIDAVSTHTSEKEVLLEKLLVVLKLVRSSSSTNREWLLQLMGRVQAALISENRRPEVALLCDVFAVTVVTLAGHDCFLIDSEESTPSSQLHLLPEALRSLLADPGWEMLTPKVIDWLHHLLQSSVVDDKLKSEGLLPCLQALRHTAAMRHPGTWQRVVTIDSFWAHKNNEV